MRHFCAKYHCFFVRREYLEGISKDEKAVRCSANGADAMQIYGS